ncbi:hypothetical protein HDIA_0967 [Hartmannibacter diazotrophicus]|uniref:Activator of Hsp90 ATPase homologue 1/2-like C-terminal domain-containing protein n=1 Tax=Hartmannibacter diazotrophicus TaxID=1482074 RepID=A0A2C9D2X3_9HYPH|nr:SRPBCC family protein [Hartmannibacter diazotrophicus]SON54508.1 hypothetical protein HDIA_0967 [Hartmannibacter diazotrophicus]
MARPIDVAPNSPRELVMARIIEAPRTVVYRCWTDPELLMQWFAPKPWQVTDAKLDVRPGGLNSFMMVGPDGQAFPNAGVYLDVVPNERVVITDAFSSAWVPSDKPFMVAEMTFEDHSGGTLYVARARHWSDEDLKAHEEMGFHTGWGQCADQLEALARTIGA